MQHRSSLGEYAFQSALDKISAEKGSKLNQGIDNMAKSSEFPEKDNNIQKSSFSSTPGTFQQGPVPHASLELTAPALVKTDSSNNNKEHGQAGQSSQGASNQYTSSIPNLHKFEFHRTQNPESVQKYTSAQVLPSNSNTLLLTKGRTIGTVQQLSSPSQTVTTTFNHQFGSSYPLGSYTRQAFFTQHSPYVSNISASRQVPLIHTVTPPSHTIIAQPGTIGRQPIGTSSTTQTLTELQRAKSSATYQRITGPREPVSTIIGGQKLPSSVARPFAPTQVVSSSQQRGVRLSNSGLGRSLYSFN
jgi:hypothetical protein